MAEAALHLIDHVLPEVPVRQWVLSLPHPIRFLLARDPALCRLVRRVFVHAVQSFYRRRARDRGIPGGGTGAVVCTQLFDSALRLDVHFHALLLDGVYTGFDCGESLAFHAANPLRDEDVEQVVTHVRALVYGDARRRGHLRRRGLLDADERLDPDAATDLDALQCMRRGNFNIRINSRGDACIRGQGLAWQPSRHICQVRGAVLAGHLPRRCDPGSDPVRPPRRPAHATLRWRHA